MPEQNDKNIRIPVKGEEGKHTGHKIRTIVISSSKGIKALYCVSCKKNITYVFAKNKGWAMADAKQWVTDHEKRLTSLKEIHIDQEPEFIKIIGYYEGDVVAEYQPNSDSFILEEEIEAFTTGLSAGDGMDKASDDGKDQAVNKAGSCVCTKCSKETEKVEGKACSLQECPDCGAKMAEKKETKEKQESFEIIKFDKTKQIVYGVFLVPDKADHDGDVIEAEDIEKVAHDFLADYRTIDEMHKNIIKADIVESSIAWKDGLSYYGKKLTIGTWFGAIKIHDKEVWNKVLDGEYKAFSVRISGVREDIKDEEA